MNPFRTLLALCCIALPGALNAQTANHDSHVIATSAATTTATASAIFKQMQTLAGTWRGAVETNPAVPEMMGDSMTVTMRVTSMGNAIMHNMRSGRRPDDPITMLYLENDKLLLTHYCDSGNRPRMQASASADGKTITFDFIDIIGPTTYGHMHHAVFTFIDANHHIEEWTYIGSKNQTVVAHFDLRRTSTPKSSAE